jgi:predicted transcriptional regulator
MKKRITLSLDDDIVEALQARGARSLSAAANEALREAIADDAHRAALLAWLDELDATHGPPASGQLAAADALLDGLERGEPLPGGETGRVSAA